MRLSPNTQVMIVDARPAVVQLWQEGLRRCGILKEVHVSEHAQDAINYMTAEGAHAHRPDPEVVLMHADSAGRTLLEWLVQNPDFAVIPTIAYGASHDPRQVKWVYCMGANGYVVEPSNIEECVATAADILAFWKHCQAPQLSGGPKCEDLLRSRAMTER